MIAADSRRETASNRLLAFGGKKTPHMRCFFVVHPGGFEPPTVRIGI